MTYLNNAVVILQRRKNELETELKQAESNLALWSTRVKLAKEKERFDLLDEASLQKDIYYSKVESIKNQIDQLSSEITKLNLKKTQDNALQISKTINTFSPKPSIFEIEETEHLEKKEILEEIKAIKYSLQTAINRLEKLENKVLKSNIKSNEETVTWEIIDQEINQELEELRRQLRE